MAKLLQTKKKTSGNRLLLGALVTLAAAAAGWWRDTQLGVTEQVTLIPFTTQQFQNWTLPEVERSVNVSLSPDSDWVEPCDSLYDYRSEVPSWYDIRMVWPNCIAPAERQGKVSAFAHAVAGTLSDRFCVQSRGEKKVSLNPALALNCAGADVHHVDKAWEFAQRTGFFNSSTSTCGEPPTKKNRLFKAASTCATLGDDGIMREVRRNGPVVVLVPVYSDLLTYTNGVYAPTNVSERLGGWQPMELLGWSSDSYTGARYWILKNSWGSDWGELGYLRLSRETLHSPLGMTALTGMPLYEEEEPEPLVLTPVSPEELDLDVIV